MRSLARTCAAALLCLPTLQAYAAPNGVAPYQQAYERTCAVNSSPKFCRCMSTAVVQMAEITFNAPQVRRQIGVFPGLAAFALDYAREIGSATDNGVSASRLGDAAAYLGKKHAYSGNQEKLNFITALLWQMASNTCNGGAQ